MNEMTADASGRPDIGRLTDRVDALSRRLVGSALPMVVDAIA